MVAHWNRVAIGRRVINIYNGNTGDRYLFKLDKISGESSNMLLFLESGVRLHTTNESYENPGMPSPFCAKLRKHLRGLRLENVQQLGQKDRVVLLTFGSGESQRHSLIIEFYARGNVLLTNATYTILSLLRSHDYDGQVKVQVGHAYPITYATTIQAPTDDAETVVAETFLTTESPMQWARTYAPVEESSTTSTANGKKKKGGDGNNAWRTLLLKPESGFSHYGPSLIEHCLLTAQIDPRQQPPASIDDEASWKKLRVILKTEGERVLNDLEIVDAKGYIFYQPRDDEKKDDEGPKAPASPYDDKLLLEFQPHVLKQHEGMKRLEFESFDRAVDAFFAQIESQKRILRAETQQAMAEQRLEKIRKDQENRAEQLMQQQESLKLQAQLVETHADVIDKAIQVVNSALDSGMDWDQLEDLIRLEQEQNHNPVALLIHRLDLEHDAIVLRLERVDAGDESSERTMNVTIDLNDTAFGNASSMFAKYRASKEKGQKTIEASEKAMQAAEESAQRQLNEAQKRKGNIASALQTKRKPLWFEKFNWFITSDNYLVIGGRDAQQNEVVVKRYLRPGDAYLHADVHGASSCILRAKRRRTSDGKTQTLPLSDQALREAGSFTICRSSAWSSRMVTSAWYVEAHQVSKTAPTGEYLTVGSFMIRGKKNYLPPSQLEMGLGVLFRLGDDEGIARHKNERRDFALMQLEQEDDAPGLVEEFPAQTLHGSQAIARPEDDNTDTLNSTGATENNDTPSSTIKDEEIDQMRDESTEKTSTNVADELLREEEESQIDKANDEKQMTKKGLSVKERKLIKKYGSLEAAQEAEEERLKAEEAKAKKASTKEASSRAKQPQEPKRGKKTKLKRMARKYADQDEEDRELALLALHAGEKEKKKDKKNEPEMNETAKEAAAQTMAILKKDASLVAEELSAEVRETLAKCVTVQAPGSDDSPVIKWDKFDAESLEQLLSLEVEEQQIAAARRLFVLKESTRIDNFSASLGGIIRTIRKYGHQGLETEAPSGQDATKRKTKAEKENEKETWRKTMAEEGVADDEVEDDAVDDTIELGKLTGKPHADDLVLFAVPVCAPYQTLSQYTYRAKLTPGNTKRGKASKACVEIFTKEGHKTPLNERNKELIKKVADTEWVAAMIGDVRISAAGAAKVTQKNKGKGGKGKKKK